MNRWNEIKTVLDAALKKSPQQRDEFIKTICGADTDLQSQVESYLKYDSVEEDFLEENIFLSIEPNQEKHTNFIGKRIGKYKIACELGAGGMGVVFLAERDDGDFEQTVAVKLLGKGLFSKAIRERFFQERKILAALRHKNIAALIDGGTTAEGIPFLIMEYIEGKPLTEYVKTNNLSLSERLQIFYKICDAVSFAHRNLIVHRDLKPANILIKKNGEPKLLDFGIAKLLSDEKTDLTNTRHRVFTPEYASPEQINGETVTTASDIYELGIILYELLTGLKPFEENYSKNPTGIWNFPSRENPPRPSYIVNNKSADKNSINSKILKGDLDTIILKALKFNPEDRYASVEKFAEDLQRYEKGLPVSARPETIFYRTGKFVSRNALSIGVLALNLLIIFVGSFIIFRQTVLARQSESRAAERLANLRNITNSLLFELNDEIGQSPTKARFNLAEKSSKYLDDLAEKSNGDSSVWFDLAVAYLKLGDLQGRPYQPNIGKTKAALESYRKSLNLLGNIYKKNPSDEKIKIELAKAHEHLGHLLGIRFKDWKPAGENLLKSIQLREEVLAKEPTDFKRRAALSDSYLYYSDIYLGYQKNVNGKANDYEGFYQLTKEALEIRKSLYEEAPDDKKIKRDLAQSYQRMANAVSYMNFDGAAKKEVLFCHQQSLKLREELAKSLSANIRDQRNLADQLMMMSDFLVSIGKLEEAEKNLRQSQKIFYSLTLVDNFDAEAQYDLGNADWRLGRVLKFQNKNEEAKNQLLLAQKLSENIAKQNPESAEYNDLLKDISNDLDSLQ